MNKIALAAAAALTAGTFGLAAIAQDANNNEAGDFDNADANKDSVVSLEEAMGIYPTLTEAIFNQADANGDGSLDAGEFTSLQGLTAGVDGVTDTSSSSEASSEASSVN